MNDILDEWVRISILIYFWPYFIAGNGDNLKEIMTLKY
jgi:hypothetical protein